MNIIKKTNYFLSLVKFSHSIFALPFAVSIFLINNYEIPNIVKSISIIIAIISARNAAMSFNRLVDLKYDSKNARTKSRIMVKKLISKKQVIIFIIVNSIIFIFSSTIINKIAALLSPIVLSMLLFYSYWKRFSMLSHIYLGLMIGFSVLAIDIAIIKTISLNSLIIFISITMWILGFDILYSIIDIKFDIKMKLHSIPSKLGIKKAIIISKIAYTLMIIMLIALGIKNKLEITYYTTILIIISIFIYQHQKVKKIEENIINLDKSIFTSNSFISILFLTGLLLEKIIRI